MSSPLRRIHCAAEGTRWMRTRPSSCTCVSSCITIASAPAGTGAPVKMRAMVPGSSGFGTAPAGIRWLTASTTPSSAISARRTA